jgi:hypothetical protein
MKVEQLENKNQFVILGNSGEIEFQSYSSRIAKINKNGSLELSSRWDYSKTTLKHLYIFLDRYFYNMDDFIQKELKNILYGKCNNKRASIQKLIDDEKIFISLKY